MTPVPAGLIYDEGKTGNVVAEATECFKNDMTKCLSYTGCGAKANDPTKYDESRGSTPLTTCCMAKAKCGAGYSCPAGTRQIANTQDKVCQGGNCASTECCADDPTKCKGASVTCDASTYKDPTKDGNEAGADDAAKKNNCCTEATTCASWFAATDSANGASTEHLGKLSFFATTAMAMSLSVWCGSR